MISVEEIEKIKKKFGIIGNSKYLNRAIEVATLVANTDLSVLITGENGSGKESFSKIIHYLSSRSNNKFIAVNCGAIPEGTVDSELFGHKKGSFTGALEDRKGYFEEADGGTLFLDEIGDLPLGTQARLLRVLEQKELIRVGTSKVQKVDVRIVAATNVDLNLAIQKGKFREDLFYRLNTVPIHVPPLRERGNDIMLLFYKFANDFADKYHTSPIQLDSEAQFLLLQYDFPGNIRQLKNIVEQISILEPTRSINKDSLTHYLPPINREMPSIYQDYINNGDYGREFLYKAIFQLKNEVEVLKDMFAKLVKFDSPTIHSADNEEKKQNFLTPNTVNIDELELHNSILEKKLNNSEFLKLDNNDEILSKNFEDEVLSIGVHERELISKSLQKHENNRKKAAASLGISERTLYRKIKALGLE